VYVHSTLADPDCSPGGSLAGQLHLRGGTRPFDVEYVAIGLRTPAAGRFHRERLTGSFRLDPRAEHTLEFRFGLPWQTPLTTLYGQQLHGTEVGLVAELEIGGQVQASDLDPVAVHPLPVEERILAALLRLGFRFGRAQVWPGELPGGRQRLPFHQRIEFLTPARYAVVDRLDVTFLPAPEQVQVVLGFGTGGRLRVFDVDHAVTDTTDWVTELEGWLSPAAAF
jgi:sporulation-control protein